VGQESFVRVSRAGTRSFFLKLQVESQLPAFPSSSVANHHRFPSQIIKSRDPHDQNKLALASHLNSDITANLPFQQNILPAKGALLRINFPYCLVNVFALLLFPPDSPATAKERAKHQMLQ
jgi:hypothetical protein